MGGACGAAVSVNARTHGRSPSSRTQASWTGSSAHAAAIVGRLEVEVLEGHRRQASEDQQLWGVGQPDDVRDTAPPWAHVTAARGQALHRVDG